MARTVLTAVIAATVILTIVLPLLIADRRDRKAKREAADAREAHYGRMLDEVEGRRPAPVSMLNRGTW